MNSRIAVDIGGTFTDVVFVNEAGDLVARKVSTTPGNISTGILEGFRAAGAEASTIADFVHGTTIALNALLEGRTPPVGLITTAGFRDVLEIMRTSRPVMYDLLQEKPRPLVNRANRLEISARMDHLGNVLRDVDEQEVREVARTLARRGISSIAVCLMHSYANPSHEQKVGAILADEWPAATISLSTEVSRMWREFERTSTAVANAATKPIVSTYIDELEQRLQHERFRGQLLVMQSNGGVMSADDARSRPVSTLMSGPVGGVTGAIGVARTLTNGNSLVTLDIGGTSADVAIVDRGLAVTRTIGSVGQWPVMVPMVDIESIGAGGGSIAQVDELGALRVGPQSAGAAPGPAAYGRGGTNATVTDANLVLGRITPDTFKSGEVSLQPEAAAEAIRRHVATPLTMGLEQAAEGIVAVVNSNMTRLMWELMIGRGYDPRDFAILAFGGGGPLHACDLAAALGVAKVIVPVEPGVFSAFGILSADVRYDRERMMLGSSATDPSRVAATFRELEEEGLDLLMTARPNHSTVRHIHSAELRYVGQDHWISVDLPDGPTDDPVAAAKHRFHEMHERLYGFRREDAPIDLVRIQVATIGHLPLPSSRPSNGSASRRASSLKGRIFAGGKWHQARIWDRSHLVGTERLEGPCLIVEPRATTYVAPGCVARLDDLGRIHIDVPVDRRS